METSLVRQGYTIELIHGKEAVNKCCICNPNFVDKIYEKLALESVADDTYGLFVKSGSDVMSTMIFTKKGTSSHIVLLCSNEKYRVGAATSLMRLFLEKAKMLNVKKVTLTVAKRLLNTRAVDFYEQFGFKETHSGKFQLLL